MKSSKRNQEGDDDEEPDTDEHAIDTHHIDVPIAQRINKLSQHRKRLIRIDEEQESKKMDIDEEIRQLEEDLAADDTATSDDDDSDDDDDDDDSGDNEDHPHRGDGGVISLSKLAHDKIEPLPKSALPQNKRRKLKGVDSTTVDDHVGSSSDKHKQRKRHNSTTTTDKQSEQQQQQQHAVSEGLKSAVQDLLQNYIAPSQIQRPPFYCRICQYQSQTQIEFDNHRTSEFHLVATKEEKKATYCKLCRKQLTSVIQMTEHLNSKPHRDRMDYVKGKQRGGGRGVGVDDRGGREARTTSHGEGRGGGGEGGKKSDHSTRQWC